MSNVPYLWLAYTDATSNLTNGCCTSNGIEWFMNHSEIPNAGSNFDPSIIASQPNPAPCLFYSQSHNIVILAIPDSSHQNQIVMYANVGDTNGISSTIDMAVSEPILVSFEIFMRMSFLKAIPLCCLSNPCQKYEIRH